jgi:hypothetical protein
VGRALERDEEAIRRWKKRRFPASKKRCPATPTLVFVDESGLSERPHRCRTWARLTLEFLPDYAPELNSVEYLRGHWKHHELPNLYPKDFWQVSQHSRQALRRMRRRPRLVTAFWKQAQLFYCQDTLAATPMWHRWPVEVILDVPGRGPVFAQDEILSSSVMTLAALKALSASLPFS